MPTEDEAREEIVQNLLAMQPRLRGYIRTLVPSTADGEDVLQETNMVIWRKAEDFEPGTNFSAWACKIAYFQVLAFRQRMARSKLTFDGELLEQIAEEAEEVADEFSPRREALRACLNALTDSQQRMLQLRYAHGGGIERIAEEFDRPLGSVRQALYRIRGRLAECIEKRIAQSAGGNL
ncbi:MAG: sigma-70 family RNA polymerase sigma factor [Verrucomicrobiales bacterium]